MTDLEYGLTFSTNDIDWGLPIEGNYDKSAFDEIHLTEETIDATIKFQPDFQQNFHVATLGPPDRRDFNGDYNFVVEIDAKETNRKKYLYSHKLNCIYVDRKVNFPVHFNWRSTTSLPLYVRATTVFSDEAQAEKRVETCLQHKHESVANKKSFLNHHVLHSDREPGTSGVYYCGDPNLPDSWFSVLVKFNTNGPKTHAYQFICKNSCSSGINRRSTGIIFTLEDETGKVYGRQSVGVRVCSCTRRDLSRDENAEPRERRGKKLVVPPTKSDHPNKKIKVEETRDEVITLPQLQVVGVEAAISGLQVSIAMMKQKLSMIKDQSTREIYTKSINDIKTYIQSLETKQ